MGFEHPLLLLLLLPVALLPFLFRGQRRLEHAAFPLLPSDPLSLWLERLERALLFLLSGALLLALSGPYLRERSLLREAEGGTVVLLVDRSSSMNEDFSGRYLAGKSRESKMAIARALLEAFVAESPGSLFALISFSTAPAVVVGPTADRAFVQAALEALPQKGRGATYLGPALLASLELLKEAPAGERIVLLVSDGATQIEPELRARLEKLFRELGARLYWLYLRSRHAPSLAHPNARSTVSPAFALHQFFATLGDRYRLFETQNRQSLQEALEEVRRLGQKPFRYPEVDPRFRLTRPLLWLALFALLLLLPLRLLEWERWP